MSDEEFQILEKINFKLINNYEVLNEDVSWLINQLKLRDTMINLMVPKLTAPINSEEWVKKYYKEEAEKRICGKL